VQKTEAQRIIRQQNREHIENLERQVAELSEEKEQLDQALQRNSELEAQIGIAPAYGTNNYIMPKILSKRNANRGVDQNTTTEAIFAIPYQCTPETNNHHWASQRSGTSQLLSNGDDSDVASRAPSPGSVWYIGGNGHGFLPAGPVLKST
jgi:hypothetical protein